MISAADVDLVVFDVLGTLVNEPDGLAEAIAEMVPGGDHGALSRLWQDHVAVEQDRMLRGERPFAAGDTVDREAAELVASRCGVSDRDAIARLATAERRLRPWDDTVAALDAFARRWPIAGLSNASRATLAALNANAGLRWHFVLSAEDAGAYKPAAAVYRLPAELLGVAPERTLLVAAHAWDLRGAQAAGVRTAYVPRPHGDPPRDTDAFDHAAGTLTELLRAIG